MAPDPDSRASAEAFEQNPVVSLEFSQFQPTQDFDTSEHTVQDTAELRAFEALLVEHQVIEGDFTHQLDPAPAGGLHSELNYIRRDGEAHAITFDSIAGVEFTHELTELVSGWREAIPHLHEAGFEEAAISADGSDESERITDPAALDALADLMREHGIFGDYATPAPETPPTLGLPTYAVRIESADSGPIELTLSPAAAADATFSAAARTLVESLL